MNFNFENAMKDSSRSFSQQNNLLCWLVFADTMFTDLLKISRSFLGKKDISVIIFENS